MTSTRHVSKVVAPGRVLGRRPLVLPSAICVPLALFHNVRTSVSTACVLVRSTTHSIQYTTEKLFKSNERKDPDVPSSPKAIRSSKPRDWSRAVGLISPFSLTISHHPPPGQARGCLELGCIQQKTLVRSVTACVNHSRALRLLIDPHDLLGGREMGEVVNGKSTSAIIARLLFDYVYLSALYVTTKEFKAKTKSCRFTKTELQLWNFGGESLARWEVGKCRRCRLKYRRRIEHIDSAFGPGDRIVKELPRPSRHSADPVSPL